MDISVYSSSYKCGLTDEVTATLSGIVSIRYENPRRSCIQRAFIPYVFCTLSQGEHAAAVGLARSKGQSTANQSGSL